MLRADDDSSTEDVRSHFLSDSLGESPRALYIDAYVASGAPDTVVVRIVGGRYKLLQLLGEGGMGRVYEAEDQHLDDVVALKLLHTSVGRSDDALERFRREVKLARRVTHENVARVYALGRDQDVHYLTMELIRGAPLRAALDERVTLSLEDAQPIAAGIARGLAAAHRAGVIHRDIKPANVLLARDGRVVITDFGIARSAVGISDTGNTMLGTPAYMAPEQLSSADITEKTDLFSFGIVLFEMLTGRLPWKGNNFIATAMMRTTEPAPDPRKYAPQLPDRVADMILRCLDPDPDARPASALEVAEAFGQAPAEHRVDRRTAEVRKGPPRLAVIPLEGEDEDLTGAIAQELVDSLGQLRGIRVLSRRMAAGLADTTLADIPASMALEYLVEGSVRPRDETRLRLVVRLIHVPSGEQRATVREDITKQELLSRIDDVVERLAEHLDGDAPQPPPAPAIDASAVELYLEARARHNSFMPNAAVTLLERAEASSPKQPLLLAALAVARARQSFFSKSPPSSALSEALSLAAEAVRGAPDHPEPRFALGYVRLHAGDPVGAVIGMRQVIARAPSSPEALSLLGELLSEVGRMGEGRRRLELALELDEMQLAARFALARYHALAGSFEQALAPLSAIWDARRERLTVGPMARFLSWQRDAKRLAGVLDAMPAPDKDGASFASSVPFEALIGRMPLADAYEELEWRASILGSSRRSRALLLQLKAEFAGWFEDPNVGLATLARLDDEGFADLAWLDRCPLLDPFRTDARFEPVRARAAARADDVIDAVWGDEEADGTVVVEGGTGG